MPAIKLIVYQIEHFYRPWLIGLNMKVVF